MTRRAPSKLVSAVGAAAAIVVLVVVHGFFADSLLRTTFLTGWALLLAIGVQAHRRWRKVRGSDASTEWLGGQGGLVLVTVMLFGMHLDFRVPDGWLDSVLAGMFVLLVASSAAAAVLLLTLRRDPQHAGNQAPRRWLLFHVSLTASLLTLGAMHGVLAHTHSVLAYIVLGR